MGQKNILRYSSKNTSARKLRFYSQVHPLQPQSNQPLSLRNTAQIFYYSQIKKQIFFVLLCPMHGVQWDTNVTGKTKSEIVIIFKNKLNFGWGKHSGKVYDLLRRVEGGKNAKFLKLNEETFLLAISSSRH